MTPGIPSPNVEFPGCSFPKLNIKMLKRNKQKWILFKVTFDSQTILWVLQRAEYFWDCLAKPSSKWKQVDAFQAGPQAAQTTAQQDKHNNTPADAQEYA